MELPTAPSRDAQWALPADLLDAVTREDVGLEDVLALVVDRLAGPCGVRDARVLAPGEPAAAGALVVPLLLLGEAVGRLQLRCTGPGAAAPAPSVLAAVAHHVAVLLKAETIRRARELDAVAADAVRRLFEEGTRATSVHQAAEVLARVSADALRTERVAVHLCEEDGRILDLLGLGVPESVAAALRAQLVGRSALGSPVWRRAQELGEPVLADCAVATPGRPGGFVATMELLSYAALPLRSARGFVGMVLCGDVSRTRTWTEHERRVARQLSLQGALVVDSARSRQAEHELLAELRHRADHDGLTGLPNRGRLLTALAELLPAAPQDGGALLLLDLDGFKQVNDTLGHHAGDELLRVVARRLGAVVREGDVPARLGGDEFAVLARGVSAPEAAALARRVAAAVAEPLTVDGVRVGVGASVGTALLPEHGQDVPGLLRAADARMYEGKKRSRRLRARSSASVKNARTSPVSTG
ncbi:sensor domain-containing diguanylate cyclase [Kineococcus rhizosphaerae]|uniref:Diguanylate cyclase (GGDEF)-like protein n=1 Tax=Kineococcus rhizosphaerae TaxID=559628 RepID=A0A2T0R062_9ACTN|nr:sensor domain-containing diguanylate cyclase [Kineococcus rhizosphaerae]PRY12521.1 diguanylate cyclase (GGDEF)-like protein [Kineococcus rhizosphaerae]